MSAESSVEIIKQEFKPFGNTAMGAVAGATLAGYAGAIIRNFFPNIGTLKIPFTTKELPGTEALGIGVPASLGAAGFVGVGITIALYEKEKSTNPSLTFSDFIKNLKGSEFAKAFFSSLPVPLFNFLMFMGTNTLLPQLTHLNSAESAGVAIAVGFTIFALAEVFLNKPQNLGASLSAGAAIFISFAGAGLLLSQISNPSTFLQWMLPLFAMALAVAGTLFAFGPYMAGKMSWNKCHHGFWLSPSSEMRPLLGNVQQQKTSPPVSQKDIDAVLVSLDGEGADVPGQAGQTSSNAGTPGFSHS